VPHQRWWPSLFKLSHQIGGQFIHGGMTPVRIARARSGGIHGRGFRAATEAAKSGLCAKA